MANKFLITICLLPLLFNFAEPFIFFNPFRRHKGGILEGFPFIGGSRKGNRIVKGPEIVPSPVNNKPNPANGGSGDKEIRPAKPAKVIETNFKGAWELFSENSGVSAMHLILMPSNKVVMYDAAGLGPSTIQLTPPGNCRDIPQAPGTKDCWAHSVEMDIQTAKVRPLKVLTDPWCSSGGLDRDGNLANSGGWADGGKSMRYLGNCETCEWEEFPQDLSSDRWYATQIMIPDGRFILVGGRRMFSYEFVPMKGKPNQGAIDFPLLSQTTDIAENNLYPFVHISTDGNLFIFANSRSILLDPVNNKVIREYPVLEGGSRNYPASGMSVLLPIKIKNEKQTTIQAEVLVCGGAKPEAFNEAEKGKFMPALNTCGRITITNPNAHWNIETMPSPRVMGDMLILPTGDVIMLHGAKKGTSAWEFADEPNIVPLLYRADKPRTERFKELEPAKIARMYHSSAALLPDGKVMVAGSNTNNGYKFTGVKFPTELRVEKFLPPYLDPQLAKQRPKIDVELSVTKVKYGMNMNIQFNLDNAVLDKSAIRVTMYRPPFTTHGYSMDQRLLDLGVIELKTLAPTGTYEVVAVGPPSSALAPPGYYLVFVVNQGVPSPGMWVQIV